MREGAEGGQATVDGKRWKREDKEGQRQCLQF